MRSYFVRHFGGRFFIRVHGEGGPGVEGFTGRVEGFGIPEQGPGGVSGAQALPDGVKPGAQPDALRAAEDQIPRLGQGQGAAAQGEHRQGIARLVEHGTERLQFQLPEGGLPALPEDLRDAPAVAAHDFPVQVDETGPEPRGERASRAAFPAAHEACEGDGHD